MPKGYSRTQIALHWGIFVLIALQYLLHDTIAEAWDKIEQGQEFVFHPLIAAHVFGGLLILALVVWRIVLRRRRGAPALPAEEPVAMQWVAKATHAGLYALMIAMPVSGGMAWFGGVEAASEAHEVMRVILLALVVLHVVGALYQQFVLKTDIMARMKRPG
jgi:cytochrome b561